MVAGADPATGALAGVCARIGSEGRSDPGRRLGDWRAGVSSLAAPTGVTSCSARCRPPVRLGEADHFATTSWHTGISENCPHGSSGQMLDLALEQYYLRARYYASAVGRFTQ